MKRPRDHRELERVLGEMRRIRNFYPGAPWNDPDILWAAALVHHFNAKTLTPDQWRRVSHDNPAWDASGIVDGRPSA